MQQSDDELDTAELPVVSHTAGAAPEPGADTRPGPDSNAGPDSSPDTDPSTDPEPNTVAVPVVPAQPAAATGTSAESIAAQRRASRGRVDQLLRGSGVKRPHSVGGKRRTAERIAKRTVSRIVSETAPTTQPIPIVAQLKGTAYQAPVESAAKREDEARMILDFAVDVGAMLLRAGAGSRDVELAVIASCTALGLPRAEIDLTSGSLTVHYSDPEGRLLTVVRVTRDESVHFAKISAVHALVADVVDGNVDYERARERLDAIRRQRRPFPEWFATLAWGVMVAALVNLLGGGVLLSGLGFVVALSIDRAGRWLGRTGLPGFFITMGQTVMATLVAMIAWNFGIIHHPEYLVAAGIVLVLPTQTLLSAVQDALANFPLTAAARFVRLVMTFAGIVAGIAGGLSIGQAIGLRDIDVVVDSGGSQVLTTLVALVASGIVAAAGATGMQAAKRILIPASLIGMVGFLCNVGLTAAGITGVANSFLSSFVVGLIAHPVAIWRKTASIVILIPALYPLLSGLSIFSAAYTMIGGDSVSMAQGLSALFLALAINAALAVGAALGEFVCAPLQSHLRNRIAQRRAANQAAAESEVAGEAVAGSAG